MGIGPPDWKAVLAQLDSCRRCRSKNLLSRVMTQGIREEERGEGKEGLKVGQSSSGY